MREYVGDLLTIMGSIHIWRQGRGYLSLDTHTAAWIGMTAAWIFNVAAWMTAHSITHTSRVVFEDALLQTAGLLSALFDDRSDREEEGHND